MEEEINNNLNSENQLYTNKGEVDSNIKELKHHRAKIYNN